MAVRKVLTYGLGYEPGNRQFLFNYTLEGVGDAFQIFLTPEEFSALSDMFRNEGSTAEIFFDDQINFFQTALIALG